MSYAIQIRKHALKELALLPRTASRKIADAIDGLADNPRPEGCKKLKGELEYFWRIRAGDYRIIYTIEDQIKIVEIRKISHRSKAYG